MKSTFYFSTLLLLVFTSCKEKKPNVKESTISAISIIKGQLNHLDTSFYQIMKFETRDDKTDTFYLNRDEVRINATDFLSLPDITKNNYSDNYTEERLIDESQNALSITATARDEKLEIQKQIIIVPLEQLAEGKVKSIFIDRYLQKNDSVIQQKLFWQVNKNFRVASIIQKDNLPEKTRILEVAWK